jgi:hypothetical protein
LSDYDRIKKNSTILAKDEERNRQKLLEEQKELKQAEAKVKIFLHSFQGKKRKNERIR